MALMAIAFPIRLGESEGWKNWVGELQHGPQHAEFVASRRALGVHERTFLQHTPMGDLVIVALEGDDPGASFGRFVSGTDEFTTWFLAKTMEFHGIDLRAPAGPPPELLVDSEA